MITQWSADMAERHLPDLARILHDCVHAGASVGFILPHPISEAEAFWADILPDIAAGNRALLVATKNGMPVGTVQLTLTTPKNQPHRADVNKLLVHPDARRRGIAKQLMQRLEPMAVAHGKSLLTLDTRSGDAAEPLYRALGFETAGMIPGYCLSVDGKSLDATTYMYKRIG